jgi:membrane protein DedA with SNARE-associated domain
MTELLAIFALTFIDGLVVAGLIINGWAAFAACVFAYSQAGIPILYIAAASLAGVFLSEQISFAVCAFWGPRILRRIEETVGTAGSPDAKCKRTLRLPRNTRTHWEKVKNLVGAGKYWKVATVVIVGRWTPVASLCPAACALAGVPYRKFVPLSATGCAAWAIAWNAIVWASVNGAVQAVRQ